MFIIDYQNNLAAEMLNNIKQETDDILGSFSEFERRLRRLFRDINGIKTAKRAIQGMRQKGSAAAYAAEFQQHAGKTDWGDNALIAKFYQGLKNHIKDDIIRLEKRLGTF